MKFHPYSASVLPTNIPFTFAKCGLKKNDFKNAALALQPSQEMPIETVCAGNTYRGKMGEGGEAQQTWILLCRSRDHVQLLPLRFRGTVRCLLVLFPGPHALQTPFTRACQPPTVPEPCQVSLLPLKKKLVRAQ